jgi:hypothetical protein
MYFLLHSWLVLFPGCSSNFCEQKSNDLGGFLTKKDFFYMANYASFFKGVYLDASANSGFPYLYGTRYLILQCPNIFYWFCAIQSSRIL